MKTGDLVKYIYNPDYSNDEDRNDLHGIVIKYCKMMGFFTVAWNDGTYDKDLVHSELELVNEGR